MARPRASVARGLGYFDMGAGIYNRETAIARSINTDTAIRWNQYVYLSQKEATRVFRPPRRQSRQGQERLRRPHETDSRCTRPPRMSRTAMP